MERNEEIRQRYQAGETVSELGKAFNLSRQWIAMIVADLPKHYGNRKSRQPRVAANAAEIAERARIRQQRRDEIIAMYADGMTQEQIAAAVGQSQSNISKIVKAADVTPPPRIRNHAKLPEILRLREQGRTQMEIADTVGVHQTTVSGLLRKHWRNTNN